MRNHYCSIDDICSYFTKHIITKIVYTCINVNFILHVISLTAPANPPDIVRVEGSCWDKTASLTWRVGALNNEEVYAYFIDWTTAYDRTTWTRLVRISEYENLRSYTLDFTKLPAYSQISFRVSVFNRIGTGDTSIPTNPSDCITQPAGRFLLILF